MAPSVRWDPLSPITERTFKPVREHEVMRVAATIKGRDAAKAAEIARHEILRWAQNRCGGTLPGEAWVCLSFDYLSGGRNSIGIRIENDTSDIWALRADDPDRTVPGRIWTTEVVVGLLQGQPARFSVRLLVSTSETELDVVPAAPGFVQQVAETCGLSRGPCEIVPEPWLIDSEEQAQRLLTLLTDHLRQLPIFVLTVPEDSRDALSPLVDALTLARGILGVGLVVVLPARFTWLLTDNFGKTRSVFGGGVRAYLAGFNKEANPYAHRLIIGEHLRTPDGAKQGDRWIRSLAATEGMRRLALGKDVLTFASIRRASLALNQQRLEREGASETEQLGAAKTRILDLEKQAEQTQAELVYFDSEHQKAEERAEAAEDQARASAFRIQNLLAELEKFGKKPDSDLAIPNSWAEFSDWCDTSLAGRVVLSPHARRSIRSAEFDDVRAAARGLLWLASSCRDRRIQGGEGSLREDVLEPGIRNSHCGADQFDLTWQGQRYTADWHVKNGGNTRDPRRCMRIYYFWEPNTQQIVIADMPAHRRSESS